VRNDPYVTGPDAADATEEFPFIDEHVVVIDAPVVDVWHALIRRLAAWDTTATRIYARASGAVPRRGAGAFPRQASTLPGFAVSAVDAPHRLVLAGRHHFSRYVLTFVLEETGGRTEIRARSHADFPGLLGQLYGLAVVRSGAHRAVTRGLLRSVQRSAAVHS
jgi:hypothetical protein